MRTRKLGQLGQSNANFSAVFLGQKVRVPLCYAQTDVSDLKMDNFLVHALIPYLAHASMSDCGQPAYRIPSLLLIRRSTYAFRLPRLAAPYEPASSACSPHAPAVINSVSLTSLATPLLLSCESCTQCCTQTSPLLLRLRLPAEYRFASKPCVPTTLKPLNHHADFRTFGVYQRMCFGTESLSGLECFMM